jgi:hypothetical protein
VLTKDLIEKIASGEIQDFIFEHSQDDVTSLALKHREIGGIPFPEIGSQLTTRLKARNKIPQWFATRGIVYPPALSMEQSSSESTALYKSTLLPEGSSLCDFTGGLGVDAYYFSARASYVRYLERQEVLCLLAEHNFRVLGAGNIRVTHSDLGDYLRQWLQQPTDYIYIDPARRDARQKKVFLLRDCEPDLTQILPLLLPHCNAVMVKLSPLFDVHLLMKEWGNVIQHIHVVSVKNECKELLVIFTREPEEGGISCINLEQNQSVQTFTYEQLAKSHKASFSEPLEYLYEPNSSIMKAGTYDIVGKNFGLKKLHRHSHLYTSGHLLGGYPGRQFKIEAVVPVDKKALTGAVPGKKANIATRNFPLTPEELYKKTGFKTGGDVYLFGTTLKDEKKVIIVCRK